SRRAAGAARALLRDVAPAGGRAPSRRCGAGWRPCDDGPRGTGPGTVTSVRAHYLQHVPFESPGSILPWLKQHGASVSSTRLFEPHTLPAADDFDLLVVMGGPMSVND